MPDCLMRVVRNRNCGIRNREINEPLAACALIGDKAADQIRRDIPREALRIQVQILICHPYSVPATGVTEAHHLPERCAPQRAGLPNPAQTTTWKPFRSTGRKRMPNRLRPCACCPARGRAGFGLLDVETQRLRSDIRFCLTR